MEAHVDRAPAPAPLDWARAELPQSWVDRLNLLNPLHFVRYVWRLLGRRRPVELPPGLPGAERLPRYLLEEFHHLPNGNYSLRMAGAYTIAFDYWMLGKMGPARRDVAERLAGGGAAAVLDLGCGGGRLAAALRDAGIAEVVGLDPSPYMLKWAARATPGVAFVQGLVEDTGFPDARFDAAGACFLFHELPGEVADRALRELHRVLRPGGRVVLCEPAPEQMAGRGHRLRALARQVGWGAALWFRFLAWFAYEPYVGEWHDKDPRAFFAAGGFELIEDRTWVPFRTLVARRR